MITLVAASTRQYTIENLAVHFDRISDISLIYYAEDGVKAIEIVDKYQPSVIIIDLEMPVINGIEATNIIAHRFPDIKIILQIEQEDCPILNLALNVGAKGVIFRTTSFQDLEKIIRLVNKGFYQIGSLSSEYNQSKAIPRLLSNENNNLNRILYDINDLRQNIVSNQEMMTNIIQQNKSNKYSYRQKKQPCGYRYNRKYLIDLSHLGNDSFFITGFVFGVLCCAIVFYFLLSF
ncbi:response regulator transcription factor [Pleurocapsales cyanobacterium LEGE 10410]|nr:response regulator transcription factor [Pleurocapsales cyanobacterium LEGE 10410]